MTAFEHAFHQALHVIPSSIQRQIWVRHGLGLTLVIPDAESHALSKEERIIGIALWNMEKSLSEIADLLTIASTSELLVETGQYKRTPERNAYTEHHFFKYGIHCDVQNTQEQLEADLDHYDNDQLTDEEMVFDFQ